LPDRNAAVADDPEALTCHDCLRRERLPESVRAAHLVCVPMTDPDEARRSQPMQRHASVVVQKSLAEGFGLTVTEAMGKNGPSSGARRRHVDQIVDG
jgi:trehalose synthase